VPRTEALTASRMTLMKLTIPIALVALALHGCQASSSVESTAEVRIAEGRTVGESIEASEVHALEVISATPSAYFEQTLLVEAEAVAVCQSKGCWMKVKDGDSTAMVRWEDGCDGKYAFPSEIVGKRILIQGSFYPKTISDEDAQHLESEAGEGVAIEREGFEFNASAILIPQAE